MRIDYIVLIDHVLRERSMRLVVNNTLVARAEQFAEKSYRGKPMTVRGWPTSLVHHTRAVAELVREARGTQVEIAAAWLYNAPAVVGISVSEIQLQFGRPVALVVEGLTDYPKSEEYGIYEQAALQAHKLMWRSESVKLVRYADVVVSLRTLADHMPPSLDAKQRDELIRGYWHLGQMCYGIRPTLDAYYLEAHKRAKQRHSYA